MNKKGFTLVELLVTISIIISLTAIVIVGVVSISNRSKEQAYERVKEQIITAAEQYFDSKEYVFEGLADDAYGVITVGMLVNEDYLNRVTDPRTGESVNPCSQVQVSRKDGRYVSEFKEYENGMKCNNDNFIALAEPGSPSVNITPYKSGDDTHGNVNTIEEWYNIEALGEYAELALYVEADTQGNGEIKGIKRCTGSSVCTNFDNDYITSEKTYEDTNVYGNDTSKTACYLATNISDKSAYTCFSAQVDTIRPTANIKLVRGNDDDIGSSDKNNNSSWYNGTVYLDVNDISDDVTSWKWSTDGNYGNNGKSYNYQEGQIPNDGKTNTEISISSDGKNRQISLELIDKAGNENTLDSKYVNIDNTRPSCSISVSGTSGKNVNEVQWYRSNVTLTGKCSDNLSGCNSNSQRTYSEQKIYNSSTAGTVYDKAGNSNACSYSTKFGIDTTAPTMTTPIKNCLNKNGGCGGDSKRYYSQKFTITETGSGLVNNRYYYNHCYDYATSSQKNLQCNGYETGGEHSSRIDYSSYATRGYPGDLTQAYAYKNGVTRWYHLFYKFEDNAGNISYYRYKLSYNPGEGTSEVIYIGTYSTTR